MQTLANAFTRIGTDVITGMMETSDLSSQAQDFYRKNGRWPTNAVEFMQHAGNVGTPNTRTRLGELVLKPLESGRLEVSLVRTNSTSSVVVDKPL